MNEFGYIDGSLICQWAGATARSAPVIGLLSPFLAPYSSFYAQLKLTEYFPVSKLGWLGSRVVSVLDWGTGGPGFKSQPRLCRVTVLGKLLTPIVPLFTSPSSKIGSSPLFRVAKLTAGLAESNGSLPPGLWLMSPAGWLPRTGVSSGTLRWVIEYGLPLAFLVRSMHGWNWRYISQYRNCTIRYDTTRDAILACARKLT